MQRLTPLLPQEPLMVDVSVSEPALVLFLNLQQLASLTDSQVSAPVPESLLLANEAESAESLYPKESDPVSNGSSTTAPKTIRGRLLILPLLAGGPDRIPCTLPDSIFQTATGGLPERRPQRVICRAWATTEAGRTD